MKQLLVLILGILSLNTFGWISMQSNCFIEGGAIAYCRACNYETRRPLYCEMSLEARTQYGYYLETSGSARIPYGQCMTGHIQANNPYRDPIIFAQAEVWCDRY